MHLPILALATWLVTGIGSVRTVSAHFPLSQHERTSNDRRTNVSLFVEARADIRPRMSAESSNSEESSSILLSVTTSGDVARATSYLPQAPQPPPTSSPPSAPQPFDTSMSYALPSECLGFLLGMIANPSFVSCLPFSLLLTSSSGFNSLIQTATQSHNYTYLNDLIAYTGSPQPSGDSCDSTMAGFLKDLRKKENCGTDTSDTGVVSQARRGLGNYQVMRTAATLVHPDTGVYCYIDALASSKPDDLYLWKLPSGNILPPSSSPTCSPCSQLLMNHLTKMTDMSASLNTSTINDAATALNGKCGPNFVQLAQKTGADDSSNITNAALGFRIPPYLYTWLVITISFHLGFHL